ncbi:MAG: biopolymer transporter ExbD [Pirellulaceae bacterium]|nr:biopolymer transporter ExbD [Pirellulaceae bacterium]
MPLKTSSLEELPSVNLTPMIDVVFLLIIFFMVGTQFSKQERQVDIRLPGISGTNAANAAPQRREVQIAANGMVYLEGQPVTLLELTRRLTDIKRRSPDLSVAVRADAQARQLDVVPVLGAINKAGVTNMAMLGLQNDRLR